MSRESILSRRDAHDRLAYLDTIGVQAAGWEAELIKRVNNDVLDTAAQPRYVGKDLNDIAEQIVTRHGPGHG
jgi:2-haloacid dehalogenase